MGRLIDSPQGVLSFRDHRIEPATARGTDADVEAELKEVVAKLHEIVDPRPAKVCVLMALFLLEAELEFDSPDSYYLSRHAPAIGELGGASPG